MSRTSSKSAHTTQSLKERTRCWENNLSRGPTYEIKCVLNLNVKPIKSDLIGVKVTKL